VIASVGEVEFTGITVAAGTPELPVESENVALFAPRVRSAVPGRIVICSELDADAGGLSESVTFNVKLEVPAFVGMPSIAPFESESPAGNDPVIAKVYGGVPPVALRIWLGYSTPAVPAASVAGEVILRLGGFTVMEKEPEPFAPCESVAMTPNT
jgi:hypothetical protein